MTSEQDLLETGEVQEVPVSPPGPRSHRARRTRSLRSDAINVWRTNQRGLLVAALGTIGLRLITEWVGLGGWC